MVLFSHNICPNGNDKNTLFVKNKTDVVSKVEEGGSTKTSRQLSKNLNGDVFNYNADAWIEVFVHEHYRLC